MLELALVAIVTAVTPQMADTVHGSIRSERTGEAIEGVRVVVVAASGQELSAHEASSDTQGAYALRPLPAGRYTLRFARFGYHDLAVEVTVPEEGGLALDVRLRPRPIAVPPIAVHAVPMGAGGVGPAAPGSRALSVSSIRPRSLTSEPDPLAALEHVPGVDLAEESPTGFHVRGGSADQNQVLLDGIPVYNATHTSGVLSAVNPDAVSRVDLHAGAPPARYGGRLSSVVDLRLARPGAAGFAVRGGAGPADLRTVVEAPLGAGGGLLIGARRTTYDLVERGEYDRTASTGFDEALAKASYPAAGGELDLVALHGTNWLTFYADPRFEDDEEIPAEIALSDRYNRVRWSTNADGATWTSDQGSGLRTRARAWRAVTHSGGTWGLGAERFRLDHGLRQVGLALELDRTRPWGAMGAGAGVERLGTSYQVRRTADSVAGERPWISTEATSANAFVDLRWAPHDRWLVDHGVRVVAGAGGGVDLEPRLALHVRPGAGTSVSLGYARVHQYVQSLRNEESVLDAAFGLEPLVSAADDRVPVARSDQLAASLQARLAQGLHLEVEAYVRRLDGLVLVAPVTAQPFAVDGFTVGRGAARGVAAALAYRGPRVDLDLLGSWGSTTRRAGSLEYRPSFERRRSIAAAVVRRLGRETSLRAALRASAGRATSALAPGFEWEPFDRYTGEVEFGGTPLRQGGALNRDRLPAYVRLDVGIRKTWRPQLLGARPAIVTWLDVRNVLGRRNAMALAPGADLGEWSTVPLSRRSLAVGLEWGL